MNAKKTIARFAISGVLAAAGLGMTGTAHASVSSSPHAAMEMVAPSSPAWIPINEYSSDAACQAWGSVDVRTLHLYQAWYCDGIDGPWVLWVLTWN